MNENTENGIKVSQPVTTFYKDGGDTAGSQTVWKSSSLKDASDHIFQFSVVPLCAEQDTEVIWRNPSPNAANSCRPIYLMWASEDELRVKELVLPNTDQPRSVLTNTMVDIATNAGTCNVQHVIQSSMKDLKLKKTWSGLGGADCIL